MRKKCIPLLCKPQFYYIKVGCKGVFVTRTCFRDDVNHLFSSIHSESLDRYRLLAPQHFEKYVFKSRPAITTKPGKGRANCI